MLREDTQHGVKKLDYINWNPVKTGFCKMPEEYKYSSGLLYETGVDNPSLSSGWISYSPRRLIKDQWLVEENTNHGVGLAAIRKWVQFVL